MTKFQMRGDMYYLEFKFYFSYFLFRVRRFSCGAKHYLPILIFFITSSKDYLRITDGKDITYGVYCGNKTGESIVASGDQVRIIFHSDDYVQRRGYVLVFTLRRYSKWMMIRESRS